MIDDEKDKDPGLCWVTGCQAPAHGGESRDLCHSHAQMTKYFWGAYDRPGEPEPRPDGRLFDALGLRLNVYQESAGACLSAEGRCQMAICRFNMDERRHGRSTAEKNTSESCALRLAERDGMTLEEIAARNGCTRERVRQLEATALKKIAGKFKAIGLKADDVRQVLSTLSETRRAA